ncbi:hypothetical protein M2436_007509 [Streptomyces sp. HB372]|nr:hypothetical protein [Streptomyces sp. HB372]
MQAPPRAPRAQGGPGSASGWRRVRTGNPGAGRNGCQERSGYRYESATWGLFRSFRHQRRIRAEVLRARGADALRDDQVLTTPHFRSHLYCCGWIGCIVGSAGSPFPHPGRALPHAAKRARPAAPPGSPREGDSPDPRRCGCPWNGTRHHRGQRQAEQAQSPEGHPQKLFSLRAASSPCAIGTPEPSPELACAHSNGQARHPPTCRTPPTKSSACCLTTAPPARRSLSGTMLSAHPNAENARASLSLWDCRTVLQSNACRAWACACSATLRVSAGTSPRSRTRRS